MALLSELFASSSHAMSADHHLPCTELAECMDDDLAPESARGCLSPRQSPLSWECGSEHMCPGSKPSANTHTPTWPDLRRHSDVGSVGSDATDLTDTTAETALCSARDMDLSEFLPRIAAASGKTAKPAQAGKKRKGETMTKNEVQKSEGAKTASDMKRGKTARPAPLPIDTQQFLPIGMMMAALAMSKKGATRPGARR